MAGGSVFIICSCGCSTLIPADATSFFCWRCQKRWPRNPRAGRTVQYGKDRPKRVYRAWPERSQPWHPRPQPVRYVPRTPPTKIQSADFRMNEAPVGPLLSPETPAVTPAKPAGLTAGAVVWMTISIVVIILAFVIVKNPQKFVDTVADVFSGSSSSSSSSSSAVCTRFWNAIEGYSSCQGQGYCSSGYSYCLVDPKGNSANYPTDWGCVPNECRR